VLRAGASGAATFCWSRSLIFWAGSGYANSYKILQEL
jgi:hypothetical protein